MRGCPRGGDGPKHPASCGKFIGPVAYELWSVRSGSTGADFLTVASRDLATKDAFRHKVRAAATQVGGAYLDLRACGGDSRIALATGHMRDGDCALREYPQGYAGRIQHLVASA